MNQKRGIPGWIIYNLYSLSIMSQKMIPDRELLEYTRFAVFTVTVNVHSCISFTCLAIGSVSSFFFSVIRQNSVAKLA